MDIYLEVEFLIRLVILDFGRSPPNAFQAYISESSVPCVLAMYYTLQVRIILCLVSGYLFT